MVIKYNERRLHILQLNFLKTAGSLATGVFLFVVYFLQLAAQVLVQGSCVPAPLEQDREKELREDHPDQV